MTAATQDVLTLTLHYPAPADRVFDAFLDVEVGRRFLFATPDGEMIEASVEPRVGGRFTFVERRPGMGDIRHVGEYREIDRPFRLVFSFGVPKYDPRMTLVTITIHPHDDGCALTLTQQGVPADYVESSRAGWGHILAGLLPACEGIRAAGWPGSDEPQRR